ncbi:MULTISPECIES: hypothetical protein [unclassified Streptomyces]|uniref:hypothetical protein n=1 Tax=unclassified Streptomyces TaxID=2593676 RepID=UPI000619FE78|nr:MULTISPECIES: hypothetical protein [unclassified Streptomyces]KKD07569.1 hypothetical protein TN53_12755 [Streptomyces sp. WM6386]KKD15182.1 hypothetical protein TR66_11820 [Streptomyces sp. WM6391]
MTEVELVAIALATGAAAGLTGTERERVTSPGADTARGVVHDLHTELTEAVRRWLSGGDDVRRGYGVRVLHAHEADPDVWRTRLLQVLTSGPAMDEEILGAARAVLRADHRAGHVIVDVAGS